MAGGNRSLEHTALVNGLMKAIGSRKDLLKYKRDTGGARAMHDANRVIRYGIVGEADIMIILSPRGRVLYLEAKTGNARQSEGQKDFQKLIISMGGYYFVFRSIDEAIKIIDTVER